MAATDFGALQDLQKKIWSLQISKQGRDESFFMSNGFMGASTSDMNRPIQRITELTETEKGTSAVLPLVTDLTGSGVVNDNQLEGNEEAINTDVQTIRIDQLRNGVKSKGKMSEQETVIRFRATAKDVLSFWLSDAIDELGFLTASGRAYTLNVDGSTRTLASQWPQLSFASDVVAGSTNRVIYAGSATSEGTLTAADKMTWNLVIKAKAFAKRKRIRGIRTGGKAYYILVLSTEQCRDLEQDADYKSIQAQAMPRGMDNPLFTNSKKVVGDVVIYDHTKVFTTLGLSAAAKWGAGGLVDGAQAMLMGAQAMGFCQLSSGDSYNESDNTDYNNRQGIAVGRIIGYLKPQYKSRYDAQSREDYGLVLLKTAAAA